MFKLYIFSDCRSGDVRDLPFGHRGGATGSKRCQRCARFRSDSIGFAVRGKDTCDYTDPPHHKRVCSDCHVNDGSASRGFYTGNVRVRTIYGTEQKRPHALNTLLTIRETPNNRMAYAEHVFAQG